MAKTPPVKVAFTKIGNTGIQITYVNILPENMALAFGSDLTYSVNIVFDPKLDISPSAVWIAGNTSGAGFAETTVSVGQVTPTGVSLYLSRPAANWVTPEFRYATSITVA
ncbi:hypothetical protein [Nitrospirillum iridis]|uniref:Uncharacterized protein n=1 Tax=Nitrospirillum iridis TaxID=765888 RepID=A0A7X0AVR2_9PROT|nr:hypothetical protein [Nitrospirillum iridis]MBB6250970.1 hypothetical protein [Nitrospirillum iridis]